MTIKIRKISKSAKLPKCAHEGDAGMDVFSQEKINLKPGQRHGFHLGFEMEIPEDFVGLYWPKSGLAHGAGLHILGGVIDSTYRGEHIVIVINLSESEYKIKKGDKIAQLLIQPISNPKLEITTKLSKSMRGKNGFGSTGKK